MLALRTPAPLPDLLALYAASGAVLKPLQRKAVLLQGARSDSIGFYRAGEMVAAALLYPLPPEIAGEDLRELVFVCQPAAVHDLFAIVKAARSTRRALPDHARIRAWCRRDNAAGRRLASLCGLRPRGGAGPFKRYEWSGHVELRARHQ